MRPIEQRTDQTFGEALKAVGFRFPNAKALGADALQISIGLRYGLMGAAASHHLLLSCPDRDEAKLLATLRNYGGLVEEHAKAQLAARGLFGSDPSAGKRIGQFARELLMSYFPMYRRLCPLELCLHVVNEEFCICHRSNICAGVSWFGKGRAKREFQRLADESTAYALHFFERRQCGLPEVKEIALLGE